jgi:ribosomal protein S12 methylthiotransferase
MESIVAETESLAAQGIKEICLIAQDTTNYGLDLYGERVLHQLMRKVSQVEGIEWVRLHYAYPGYFSDELIEEIKSNPRVCHYVDMPLQHSEDTILKRMRRPGRQRDIRELVKNLRKHIPDVAIRTSIIVGFPGETEEEFQQLKSFVKEIQFDRLGVFTYSQEEGTPAARLPDQVLADVAERRASELMETQRGVAGERNGRFIGQVLPVLIERFDEEAEVFVGRTQYDAPEIDGEVYVSGYKGPVGQIIPIRITHSYDFDLSGEVVKYESCK